MANIEISLLLWDISVGVWCGAGGEFCFSILVSLT